jgi:Zn ribbon nucleic-acid-binding protein
MDNKEPDTESKKKINYAKNYKLNHPDKIDLYRINNNQMIECPDCHIKFNKSNKSRHIKTKQHKLGILENKLNNIEIGQHNVY